MDDRVGDQSVQQAIETGPEEAALTELSAIPSESSSYSLQLDPSGQNLQSTVMFQPEFVEEHQFSTSYYNTQGQVDDLNIIAALPAPTAQTEVVSEPFVEESVPEFTVEIEIATEADQLAWSVNSGTVQELSFQQNQPLEYIPVVQGGLDTTDKTAIKPIYCLNFTQEDNVPTISSSVVPEAVSTEVYSDLHAQDFDSREKDICKIDIKIETDSEATCQVTKTLMKEDPPDNIMDFTEEAIIPPLLEILPTPKPTNEEVPPVITAHDEEDDDDDEDKKEEPMSTVSKFLYEGIDPDDELYISYLKRPNPSKTAMCILCYEWFDGEPERDAHLHAVHKDNMKLYGCKRCDKQFWARFLRQRHEKLHRYDIKGSIKRYRPRNRPFDHFVSKHYIKRLRPAPYTQEFRNNLKDLHSQIKSSKFDCIQCGQVFQAEEELREHYDESHALQTCIHCRKLIESGKALKQHEREVHGLLIIHKNYPGGAWKLWEDNWECKEPKEKDDIGGPVILNTFHNPNKRTANENSSCEEVTTINCNKLVEFGCEEVTVTECEVPKPVEKKKRRSSCGKQMANQERKFVESSKGKKADPKPSPVSFLYYDEIEFEEQKTEPLSKRSDLSLKYDQCKTSFDNDINLDLQRYVKKQFPNFSDPNSLDRKFGCDACERSYKSPIELERHMRIHTGETPYNCEYCGMGFRLYGSFHSHRKRVHTGEEPHICEKCGKGFIVSSNLTRHLKTHFREENLNES